MEVINPLYEFDRIVHTLQKICHGSDQLARNLGFYNYESIKSLKDKLVFLPIKIKRTKSSYIINFSTLEKSIQATNRKEAVEKAQDFVFDEYKKKNSKMFNQPKSLSKRSSALIVDIDENSKRNSRKNVKTKIIIPRYLKEFSRDNKINLSNFVKNQLEKLYASKINEQKFNNS